MTDRTAMIEAIDRYGADFSRWPDAALANAARQAVLADRGLRAYRDDAAGLAAALGGARRALDAEIAASGAAGRIAARLSGAALSRGPARRWWVGLAAALVIAAGLGSLADLTLVPSPAPESFDVVVLDPLVFGPAEAEQP